MPKVSIVLPNYNYARYLDERIQSILDQTYQDFELIILDDASTDNSLEVIGKYTEDPRVKTKFYSENSGLPYKRWNDGADLAQGDYLLIAGADDSCHPTLLEKLVEKLDNNPSVGLAFTQSWEIDGDGKHLRSMKEWTDDLSVDRWARDFVSDGKDEIEYLLVRNTIPNASSVLMRRSVFIEAGKFNEQLRLTADWMLWVKMLIISDIAFVAEPLNYFRTHANTVRSNTEKNALNIEESCQVRSYMLRNPKLNFSPEKINKICDGMVGHWANIIFGNSAKMSLERNFKIYKFISSIDPQLNQRLIFKLGVRLFKLRELKQWLSSIKLKAV